MNSFKIKMSAASLLISAASLMAHAAPASTDFSYGSEVSTDTTQQPLREIDITDHSHAIDVQKGETVELVSGNAREAWKFDGVQPEFTLAHVFPNAEHANSIRVYVADPDHQD